MGKRTILIIMFSVLSVLVTQIVEAAIIHVTTTQDNVPGSLRAAITEANTNGRDNTIIIPAGIYILEGEAREDNNVSGDLDIYTRCKLAIKGVGTSQTIIDGNVVDRVLHILKGTVAIADLTVWNGNTTYGTKENGGGISNGGNLTLTRCDIKENKASEGSYGPLWFDGGDGGHGGGIYNYGTLTLTKCIVMGNRAGNGGDAGGMSDGGDGGHGGGIYNEGTLILNNCTIANNMSGSGGFAGRDDGFGGNGGGIYNSCNLTMSGCTVNGNISCQEENHWDCGVGGGFYNQGYLVLLNCTISGNQVGGGLYNDGYSQFINTTVVYNGLGGINNNWGSIRLKNSIIAYNTLSNGDSGPDCYGTFDWVCYSLIADSTDCILTGYQKANILAQDPLLGPLADNGGPTQTHALLPGSPAIDAGNSSGLYTDQRGYKRPVNILGIPNVSDGADIGAYEYIAPFSTADSH